MMSSAMLKNESDIGKPPITVLLRQRALQQEDEQGVRIAPDCANRLPL